MPELRVLDAAICDVNQDNFLDAVNPGSKLRPWEGFILHHSYAPVKPVWDGRDYAKIFDRFHKESNNWTNGLGYQFVVNWNPDKAGEIRIQASYRWVYQVVGSHTLNNKKPSDINLALPPNEGCVGLCIVGNFDITRLPPETYLAIKAFTDTVLAKLNIKRENVWGHYRFQNKTCPGRLMDCDFFRR